MLIPTHAQPDATRLDFDLSVRLAGVVGIRSQIHPDAFTAAHLGTEREGSGVVIDDNGLIVTIGYLINEAEQIWLTTHDGVVVPGHSLAYDFATGFGLVQALGRLDAPAIPMGSAKGLGVGSPLVIAAAGGPGSALSSRLIARREFAGYWEYLLEEALFCHPAHPHWGGSAVLGPDGKLVAIGSLLVQIAGTADQTDNSNMLVPIDELRPILGTLLSEGRVERTPRPWLGIYAHDAHGGVIVGGTAERGPAAEAGLEEGDLIVEINEMPIGDLADFYRQLWSLGEPGVEVGLTLLRASRRVECQIRSADRQDFTHKPRLH